VPARGTTTLPIGLGLEGSWIALEPPGEANAEALAELDRKARLHPAMGGGIRSGTNAFAPEMLIRERREGAIVGVVLNHRMPADIAAYFIYLDPDKGRAGYGIEATALYVSHLFDCGARLVTADVLSFNRAVIGILGKAGIKPQARLREHAYAAGRFWDVLVFSFGVDEWIGALARYRPMLPGGDRPPVAFG
jgi:RimJ/RimL family protein N-acetyltransferase